jgi:hypothetical protein
MHRFRLIRLTTRFEDESRRMIVWLALLVTGLAKILSATTVDEVITRLVPKIPHRSLYWLYLGLLRFTTHSRSTSRSQRCICCFTLKRARRGHDVGVRRVVCGARRASVTGCVCRWRLLS